MRILIATSHRGIIGGVETYLRDLLPRLAARGHEVALLVETEAAGAAIDSFLELPCWRVSEGGLGAGTAFSPDVCYLHGLESVATEEALLDRFPTILFSHNYHGTCVSGTKMHALPCPRPCDRTLGLGCLAAYLPRRCGGLNPWTMWSLYRLQQHRRRLLPRFAAVAVASRHMRQEVRRHGVAESRLHLLPLYPPDSYPMAELPVARPLTGRVLMVGRLTPLKGGAHLVAAMTLACQRLNRPLTLVVAGDGPERGVMEAAAHQAGLPIHFTGWVDAGRRAQLMRGGDVLAVPSLWPEPFGLVGIEAGCVGLPAVGHAVGGIPDWLRPGESGELAPGDPPTTEGLADALVRALADPDRLAQLGQGAWRVAQEYTAERHLDRLEAVLASATNSREERRERCSSNSSAR